MKILAKIKDKIKPCIPSSCEWKNSCNCDNKKQLWCELCKWYWVLDSGYGYCRALPDHIIVAWCRDICSLFAKKGD